MMMMILTMYTEEWEENNVSERCFFSIWYTYAGHPMKEGTKWARDRSIGRCLERTYRCRRSFEQDREMNEANDRQISIDDLI